MASNALPDPQNQIWSLAADMSDGFTDHDPGIVQNTRAKLDADLQAARDTQTLYTKAGLAEDEAQTARNVANSNAKAVLALTKRQLADVPGALKQIWPPGTTEIPSTISERLGLLGKVADYLRDHPTAAVETKNFTEAKLGTAFTSLTAAKSDLNSAVSARVDTKKARDLAQTALRQRMNALIAELGAPSMLTPEDDRWYGFGLVPPAGILRPGIAPDDVILRQVAPGLYRAAWSATPRAQKYRPFYMVTGRDADWIELPFETDLDLLLENLPATGTLKFQVQAHNPAGDSPKSEVATLSIS